MPIERQQRYDQLIAKRDAETLTAEEHVELLQLSQQAEAIDVQRIEALTKLRQLLGATLSDVLQRLQSARALTARCSGARRCLNLSP